MKKVIIASFFANNFFRGHFFTKESVYFWVLREILRLLIPNKSPIVNFFFYPYVVHDPKGQGLCARGHWIKKLLFAIFLTFSRETTDLHLTFI